MKRTPSQAAKKAEFRPMTELEKARALCLGRCRFAPATFSKRFARDIQALAWGPKIITQRQADRLAIQCYIFRRQIPAVGRTILADVVLNALPAELIPQTPPPGYVTRKQRDDHAKVASARQ